MSSTGSSAIIDRKTAEAFLSQAAKENLIWSTRETDGVFEKIVNAEYNHLVIHQLRERLVVSPKLVLYDFPEFLWETLDGPLKDNGHLANLEKNGDEPVSVKEIPLDVLSGLLGKVVTESELRETLAAVGGAYDEQRQFELSSGKPAPEVFTEDLHKIFRSCLIIEGGSNYSNDEIEAQRTRNSIYAQFTPYAKALEEYSHLAKIAMRYDILLGTPLLSSGTPAALLNPMFTPQENNADVALFRIVCNELGRTTFRPTLSGTLALSREPATKALREMMHLWLSQLSSGDEGELRRIKAEIATATASLQKLEGVQTAGRITTWIAIPLTLVELLLTLPPLLGVTASSIGVFNIGKEQRVREKYFWASFGGT